jgi:hypothetical protein
MIIVGGTNQHGNILHIVLGPESSFWMGLHGAVLSNITQLLNAMDSSQPVFLHVSRCESESQMAELISAHAAAGVQYPFQVPTNVFIPTKPQSNASSTSATPPTVKPAATPAKQAVPLATPAPNTVVIQKGKCARCGSPRKELVPKVDPTICYDCLHLDMMLAASRRAVQEPPNVEPPPAPTGE